MDCTININSEKCSLCLRCVRVCPSLIFSFAKGDKSPKVANPESCIVCAHCLCVCEDEAISHSLFNKEDVRRVDYSHYPTPEAMMELLRARRSRREFGRKPIAAAHLELIQEAGRLAPTASNSRAVKQILITDPEILRSVVDFTMANFLKLHKILTFAPLKFLLMPFMGGVYKKYLPTFTRMKEIYGNGGDPILRGATSLILYYTPKGHRFGVEDSNLAYQNSSLMAESLDVGHFYTGFVLNVAKSKKGKLERMLGIEGGRITAGLALGVPQFRYPNYVVFGE